MNISEDLEVYVNIGKMNERLICQTAQNRKEYKLELGGFGLSLLQIKTELVDKLLKTIEDGRDKNIENRIDNLSANEQISALIRYQNLIDRLDELIHDDYISILLISVPLAGQLVLKQQSATAVSYDLNENKAIHEEIAFAARRSKVVLQGDPAYRNRLRVQTRIANDLSEREAIYQWAMFLRKYDQQNFPSELTAPLFALKGAITHIDLICTNLAELDKIHRMFPIYLKRATERFFTVTSDDRWLTDMEQYVSTLRADEGTRIRCDTLLTALSGEQLCLRNGNRYLRVCEVCGRFFFSAYPNTKYCNGFVPDLPEISCKNYGKNRAFEQRTSMRGYKEFDRARKSYSKWLMENLDSVKTLIRENKDKNAVNMGSFEGSATEMRKIHKLWMKKAMNALTQYHNKNISTDEFKA